MTDAPTIRAFSVDEWRAYRDLRLRALADSPDAFGSTLAEETGRLDTEWARRLASSADSRVNLPLVAEVRGEPIGLAWGRIDTSAPDVATLYQMWVAPSHRGVGAGQMLLEAVIAWARARNASSLDLGVTCGDSPARRLYERAGFKPMGEPQPLRPGSTLLAQSMRLALRGAAEQDHRAARAARRSS
jgi:GNAT superfamily N-acetyltransferase